MKKEHERQMQAVIEEREEQELLQNFKKTVREKVLAGLVNQSNEDIIFTSYRLGERKQLVKKKSKIQIDWAYKAFGIFSSTGNPNVTVRWEDGNYSASVNGGQTLVIKPDGSF